MPIAQPLPRDAFALLAVWARLTIRDWRFWAFLGLTGATSLASPVTAHASSFLVDTYAIWWLLPSIPLCLHQLALLQAALRMGGPRPICAFLAANALVLSGLIALTALGPGPFPQSCLDGVRWWGMVAVVGSLPISVLFRSLLLGSMAWFGSACATYSNLGVWIDIWPRPDRASMVSLLLAAGWLALAAGLVLCKAPHEVRHSG